MLKGFDCSLKFRAGIWVRRAANAVIYIDGIAARFLERIHLERFILFVGRDAGIADFHAVYFGTDF